jgi:hypothetical protein
MNNTKAKQEAERVTKHIDPTGCTSLTNLAAKIVAKPAVYGAEIWALAQAYESRGERIADLEDDVERLRPREAFVPETLAFYSSGGIDTHIETERQGGITITVDGDDGSYATVADKAQATQLTTALAKWAGVGGVGWRSVDDPPKAIVDVLLTNGSAVSLGLRHHDGVWNWSYAKEPTHWAPLPKPPEAT